VLLLARLFFETFYDSDGHGLEELFGKRGSFGRGLACRAKNPVVADLLIRFAESC
jgi:hypothetical protein